jgi:hypothetical protein
MKAIAKMYRIHKDGSETPIEAPMLSIEAQGTVTPGEKILIRLWHGHCLEAEATVEMPTDGLANVKLADKKVLRKDPPPEALC